MTRKPSRFGRKPKNESSACCRLSPTFTAEKTGMKEGSFWAWIRAAGGRVRDDAWADRPPRPDRCWDGSRPHTPPKRDVSGFEPRISETPRLALSCGHGGKPGGPTATATQ